MNVEEKVDHILVLLRKIKDQHNTFIPMGLLKMIFKDRFDITTQDVDYLYSKRFIKQFSHESQGCHDDFPVKITQEGIRYLDRLYGAVMAEERTFTDSMFIDMSLRDDVSDRVLSELFKRIELRIAEEYSDEPAKKKDYNKEFYTLKESFAKKEYEEIVQCIFAISREASFLRPYLSHLAIIAIVRWSQAE